MRNAALRTASPAKPSETAADLATGDGQAASGMDLPDPETLFREAVDFHNRGRFADAVACYDRVIRLNPNIASVHSNRGAALYSLHLVEESLASFDRAVELDPGSADAHNNRANALTSLKRLDEAILSSERAIALRPAYAEAHYNRANALKDTHRLEEAVRGYDSAVALKPDFAEAHCNRGNVLKDLQRWEEALASYDVARALKPDMEFLFGAWMYAKLQICDFSDCEQQINAISAALRQGKKAATPFQMIAISGSPDLQRRAAETYAATQTIAGDSRPRIWNNHEKIRLAYFSADFHDHATMHLMAGMLSNTIGRSSN